MAAGILRIQSFEARRSAPAAGVTVTITGQGFSASRLTDDTGNTQDPEIDAPDQALSLEEDNTTIQPYAVCDLVAEKPGFETIHIEGVQIFAGQVTLAPLEMTPANARVTPPSQSVVIPPHSLFAPGGGSGPAPDQDTPQGRVLSQVVIPTFITVHLGKPSESARNVTVSFQDYIANVASSEVYPTWVTQNNPNLLLSLLRSF